MFKNFMVLAMTAFVAMPSFAEGKRRRAIILGIDGAVGHLIEKRAIHEQMAPSISELMLGGTYQPCSSNIDKRCARTHSDGFWLGAQWVTAPGWTSVMTGVGSKKHRVMSNSHAQLKHFSDSKYQSIFHYAKEHGLKTAAGGVGAFITSLTTKNERKLGVLDYACGFTKDQSTVAPDATSNCILDWRRSLVSDDNNRDNNLKKFLVEMVNNPDADLIMGVFDQVDGTGHEKGFSDNEYYMDAISQLDLQIQEVIKAIDARVEDEDWLVVVTADHGGHCTILGKGAHALNAFSDTPIPFIINVRTTGSYFYKPMEMPVTHMDAMPTVLNWLGILHQPVDGKVQGLGYWRG